MEGRALLPILTDFKGVVHMKANCAIIINKLSPGTVRPSCESSRGSQLLCQNVNISLLLRSEGPKHGVHLLDHDASFPHCIDASETGDNVIPHSEDELELVMGGFFEREGMAPGDVGGGGEWEWQLKLFSPFCPNP